MNKSSVPELTPALLERIRAQAREFGFDHLAVASPSISETDRSEYLAWLSAGHLGTMDYMSRDPEKRMDLTLNYPGVRSVITLGITYYQGALPEKPGKAYGRVARYAWGLDYHDVIAERLNNLLKAIDELLAEAAQYTVAIDTKPVLERALARASGLGFVGKNTVLIIPNNSVAGQKSYHAGSFVFLSEIFLDLPLSKEIKPAPSKNGCGQCTLCLTHCPTEAFEGPYKLQADKCISYLTIENKGFIPRELRGKVGDWLFGCDVCQDVCPFNARAFETMWPEFSPHHGPGPWVSLKEIMLLENQKIFKEKWGKTPFSRSKRKGLIRNACVVAGNSEDESLLPVLINLLKDSEPMVRGHALWAVSKLASPKEASRLAEVVLTNEEDLDVRGECEQILRQN